MPVNDELGKRMKTFYEQIPQVRLMRRTPVAIRIDGKAFHTFTRGFVRPYDQVLRNAIELSDISGVYVKVIVDYTDEDGKKHKTGEELFITGKDQMIYYPRPEHTFITYNGRTMHHAIAIPKGEGRYIMNRMTGEIKTVKGPAMYLPDPRTEVAVRRTLSRSQCELWYPGNKEVLEANGHGALGKDAAFCMADGSTPIGTFADSTMFATTALNYVGTPTKKETNKINRTNTFTPPRTISLDSSKYEGAVAVDVWTGYAVNVISKDGTRQVVKGPQTILLDYDQTLEMLELSTGKPKTTDHLERVAFLRYENNRVSDIINVETSDFVQAQVKVSYQVNFDEDMSDKWFSVDNYVKHMCDWARSAIKKAARDYTISEFHDAYQDILVEAIKDDGADGYLHKFNENGMIISDVEILSMSVETGIQRLIDQHQQTIVSRALDLTAAKNSADTEKQIIEMNCQKVELAESYAQYKAKMEAETEAQEYAIKVAEQEARDAEQKRQQEVLRDIQELKDAIFQAEQERKRQANEAEVAHKQKLLELEAERERKAAESMKLVMEAIGPDLAASMTEQGNRETLTAIAQAVSPYAIAGGKSVSEAVSEMLRGTTLEEVVRPFLSND